MQPTNQPASVEGSIVTRLSHPDCTILQLLAPKLILHPWSPPVLLQALHEEEQQHKGPEKIRARLLNLCYACLLLLDCIPTWGVWDRPIRKKHLKETIDALKTNPQSMDGDPWQGMPHEEWERLSGFPIPQESYTDVFFKNTNWRTHYPLCDFIREIEVEKGHLYY